MYSYYTFDNEKTFPHRRIRNDLQGVLFVDYQSDGQQQGREHLGCLWIYELSVGDFEERTVFAYSGGFRPAVPNFPQQDLPRIQGAATTDARRHQDRRAAHQIHPRRYGHHARGSA